MEGRGKRSEVFFKCVKDLNLLTFGEKVLLIGSLVVDHIPDNLSVPLRKVQQLLCLLCYFLRKGFELLGTSFLGEKVVDVLDDDLNRTD